MTSTSCVNCRMAHDKSEKRKAVVSVVLDDLNRMWPLSPPGCGTLGQCCHVLQDVRVSESQAKAWRQVLDAEKRELSTVGNGEGGG
jgi:hypothetical protein